VPCAPRAAQKSDSHDSDFEVAVPAKKKPKAKTTKEKSVGEAEVEEIPEEPVLGIAPVYELPPDINPDQYKQIIGPHISESFVTLNDAPAEVRKSFDSIYIPREKIIDTFVLILSPNEELNAAIISSGLQSFVKIVKDLGWLYTYVGGTMRSLLVGGVDLDRSVPSRGTMQRPGSPS